MRWTSFLRSSTSGVTMDVGSQDSMDVALPARRLRPDTECMELRESRIAKSPIVLASVPEMFSVNIDVN